MSTPVTLTKNQLQTLLDQFVELIDGWNDLAEEDDRGRDNKALCLVLWDDGSGQIGTLYKNPEDLNIQCEFHDSEELTEYLSEWFELEEETNAQSPKN